MKLLIVYWIVINILALSLMLYDKCAAKCRGWRIPEAVLLSIAVLGGAAGELLGMLLFRHKTRHLKFVLSLPLLLLLQAALCLLFLI